MGVKSLILKQIQIKISDYLLKLLIIFFKKKRENLSLNIFWNLKLNTIFFNLPYPCKHNGSAVN